MTEFIKNAWRGWQAFTENGKLVALLLIALLLFWFWKKDAWKKYRRLFFYTTVATIACVCPITAAVLMAYQTKFYDYQWIWTYVPMTIVIAMAGTLMWIALTQKAAGTRLGMWKKLGVTLVMAGLLYSCGSLGNSVWDVQAKAEGLAQTRKILDVITQEGQKTDIVLWAPREIMEYARALDGNIRMPYGRNMWDHALNGYSYDTYGETEIAMYTWMTTAEETGMGVVCSDWLVQTGVNQVLLPKNLLPELVDGWAEALGKEASLLEGYYWIALN